MTKTIYVADKTNSNGERKVISKDRTIIMSYTRVGNDIYGNPLYHIRIYSHSFKRLSNVYRNYESKGYYLTQAYNIESEMYQIMKNFKELYFDTNKLTPFTFDESCLKGYREIEVI